MDGEPEFAQRGAAAVQPAATLKTRVRVLFRRQAEEEYEEEMRHPADAGSCDGARCCRDRDTDGVTFCHFYVSTIAVDMLNGIVWICPCAPKAFANVQIWDACH